MKRKEFLGIFFAVVIGLGLLLENGKRETLYCQQGIAGEIIRFHVIADSDCEADQLLKLKVKETVVARLREKLCHAKDIEEAREIILENMGEIEETANEVIEKNGFSYQARASLGQAVFPVKMYGDLTFPAGQYEALKIELGKAEGKNWWCVMFPTLCYVDETKQEITEENKEKFQKILTQEEYDSITQKEGNQVFYKFKIQEYLYKVIDYFSD